MTRDEVIAHQSKLRAFASTPIGTAFNRFKNAYARAWTQDTEESLTDRNRKSTAEAWVRANEAERELLALIVPQAPQPTASLRGAE